MDVVTAVITAKGESKVTTLTTEETGAALMADARLRRFDAVVVWKLDRFGRFAGALRIRNPGTGEYGDSLHRHFPGPRHGRIKSSLQTPHAYPRGRRTVRARADPRAGERRHARRQGARHQDRKRNRTPAPDLRSLGSGGPTSNGALNRESSSSNAHRCRHGGSRSQSRRQRRWHFAPQLGEVYEEVILRLPRLAARLRPAWPNRHPHKPGSGDLVAGR